MKTKPKSVLWDIKELYKTRVIVLLEVEPLSNKYRRVVFDYPQFQGFIRFLTSLFPVREPIVPGQPYNVDIKICKDEDFIHLPENIQDYQ